VAAAPSSSQHFRVLQGSACFLTLAEKGYPKKLAFQYLEELSREFGALYAAQVRLRVPGAGWRSGACQTAGPAVTSTQHALTCAMLSCSVGRSRARGSQPGPPACEASSPRPTLGCRWTR
jgi:hypothetical protein